MQDIILTPDKILNSLVYGSPLCIIIYTSYKLKNGPVFMALINWYFRCSIISLILCKEYLNVATFRISVLLLIKSWTFDVLNAILCHHIQKLYIFKNGPAFLAHPVYIVTEILIKCVCVQHNSICATVRMKCLPMPASPFAVARLSTTASLSKNRRSAVPKITTDRSKALTYEEAQKPEYIGVRKSWNSWNTSMWLFFFHRKYISHTVLLLITNWTL